MKTFKITNKKIYVYLWSAFKIFTEKLLLTEKDLF